MLKHTALAALALVVSLPGLARADEPPQEVAAPAPEPQRIRSRANRAVGSVLVGLSIPQLIVGGVLLAQGQESCSGLMCGFSRDIDRVGGAALIATGAGHFIPGITLTILGGQKLDEPPATTARMDVSAGRLGLAVDF